MLVDYNGPRSRRAEEGERRRRQLQELGDEIESRAEWQWFGTFSPRHALAPTVAWEDLKPYLAELDQAAGGGIALAVVLARGDSSRRIHFHLLAAGVGHLDLREWERKAERRFGNCQLRQYDAEDGGAAYYLAKNVIDNDGELRFEVELLEADAAPKGVKHEAESSPAPAAGRRRGRPGHRLDVREVVRLRDDNRLTWSQIAEILQAPRSTVRKAYRSANESGEFIPRAEIQQRGLCSRPNISMPTGETAAKRRRRARIYVFAVNSRPHGGGSANCWLSPRGRLHIEETRGRTKLEGEWAALVSAISQLRPGASAEIVCDLPLLAAQFEERLPIDMRLQRAIRDRVRARGIRDQRQLDVKVVWMPPNRNRAAMRWRARRRRA